MIDKYDIAILEAWLILAKAHGTDAIKIVAGEEPGTWIVRRTLNKGEQP